MKKTSIKKNSHALLITVCIFFFWGFTASGNALLIPILKEKFGLSQYQSQYVELSFYIAYFVGSLMYFLISKTSPKYIQKIGLKKIMITGLIISAIGTVLLSISSDSNTYLYVLLSLFTIAIGFSLQQIIANSLIYKLGGEKTGTQKLILAGAINSLGNTIAPLLLSHFIFKQNYANPVSLGSIQPLLYFIAFLYLVFALFFRSLVLPDDEQTDTPISSDKNGIFKFPQLWLGMIAIFFYVGCEVSLQSNLPALIASKEVLGLDTKDAIQYFSLFGGSLLIGRWTGAISNFKIGKSFRILLIFIVPFIAFIVVLLANYLKGTDLRSILDYAPWLLSISIVVYASGESPQRMLMLSSAVAAFCVLGSILSVGKVSMYFIICTANFSALMWPCIFSLAIKKLGAYTQEGASLLVMMIIGGAIIPPLQGILADHHAIGIKYSFSLPLIGYFIIFFYANFVHLVQKG